jgi:hypothetical protein
LHLGRFLVSHVVFRVLVGSLEVHFFGVVHRFDLSITGRRVAEGTSLALRMGKLSNGRMEKPVPCLDSVYQNRFAAFCIINYITNHRESHQQSNETRNPPA